VGGVGGGVGCVGYLVFVNDCPVGFTWNGAF
jgi:hypothetical protein